MLCWRQLSPRRDWGSTQGGAGKNHQMIWPHGLLFCPLSYRLPPTPVPVAPREHLDRARHRLVFRVGGRMLTSPRGMGGGERQWGLPPDWPVAANSSPLSHVTPPPPIRDKTRSHCGLGAAPGGCKVQGEQMAKLGERLCQAVGGSPPPPNPWRAPCTSPPTRDQQAAGKPSPARSLALPVNHHQDKHGRVPSQEGGRLTVSRQALGEMGGGGVDDRAPPAPICPDNSWHNRSGTRDPGQQQRET